MLILGFTSINVGKEQQKLVDLHLKFTNDLGVVANRYRVKNGMNNNFEMRDTFAMGVVMLLRRLTK